MLSKLNRTALRLCLASAVLATATGAQAFCGFFAGKADASLFNEASQVILARDGKRTVISMLNDFKGPLRDFALVVPVPQVLEKGQVRIGDKRIFDRLDAYSAPRVAEYFDPDPCPVGMNDYEYRLMEKAMPMAEASAAPSLRKSERAKALGVTVEDSYTVGEYDIVMLSAKQSNGLETWLHENGYKMPPGAAAALKPYVAQDMKFFVAKVNLQEQAATGVQYLRPLQFAFESDKFMLPIRLGMINAAADKPQDLIAYVLTRQGRVESANYRTVKLPANENLPPAVKKDFNRFYKAMFDHQARQEAHRVVFTEYFWDMAWCDPCAADPLSSEELRQAGVFWLHDGQQANESPAVPSRGQQRFRRNIAPQTNGAQNALLTRLHVRYTPKTFPEDLVFLQTKDRTNWQTRYVVQQPFNGSLQHCRQKAADFDCETHCQGNADCIKACKAGNTQAIEQARRYYSIDLPQRQQSELQTLIRYTGWSLDEASRFAGMTASVQPSKAWWQNLFDSAPDATKNSQNKGAQP